MRWNKFGLVVFGIALTGCASTQPALDATSLRFGDAVAQNIAAQRVAPSAEDKADTFIPPNRARQKAALKAYEEGTVAEPTQIDTTE